MTYPNRLTCPLGSRERPPISRRSSSSVVKHQCFRYFWLSQLLQSKLMHVVIWIYKVYHAVCCSVSDVGLHEMNEHYKSFNTFQALKLLNTLQEMSSRKTNQSLFFFLLFKAMILSFDSYIEPQKWFFIYTREQNCWYFIKARKTHNGPYGPFLV